MSEKVGWKARAASTGDVGDPGDAVGGPSAPPSSSKLSTRTRYGPTSRACKLCPDAAVWKEERLVVTVCSDPTLMELGFALGLELGFELGFELKLVSHTTLCASLAAVVRPSASGSQRARRHKEALRLDSPSRESSSVGWLPTRSTSPCPKRCTPRYSGVRIISSAEGSGNSGRASRSVSAEGPGGIRSGTETGKIGGKLPKLIASTVQTAPDISVFVGSQRFVEGSGHAGPLHHRRPSRR
mmetsp:Transcript_18734/g.35703  ORF Transcript_18734/g.35703 Transcript_18734/m.35703 type:complete len:241 (-) Transcript_18734:8-730(-)